MKLKYLYVVVLGILLLGGCQSKPKMLSLVSGKSIEPGSEYSERMDAEVTEVIRERLAQKGVKEYELGDLIKNVMEEPAKAGEKTVWTEWWTYEGIGLYLWIVRFEKDSANGVTFQVKEDRWQTVEELKNSKIRVEGF